MTEERKKTPQKAMTSFLSTQTNPKQYEVEGKGKKKSGETTSKKPKKEARLGVNPVSTASELLAKVKSNKTEKLTKIMS